MKIKSWGSKLLIIPIIFSLSFGNAIVVFAQTSTTTNTVADTSQISTTTSDSNKSDFSSSTPSNNILDTSILDAVSSTTDAASSTEATSSLTIEATTTDEKDIATSTASSSIAIIPFHAEINGLTGSQLESLFSPNVIKNPSY